MNTLTVKQEKTAMDIVHQPLISGTNIPDPLAGIDAPKPYLIDIHDYLKNEIVNPTPKIVSPADTAELIKDELVPFTFQLAGEFLNCPLVKAGLEIDRTPTKFHVEHLFEQERQGSFFWQIVDIDLAEYNGEIYRLNGQQTSWMRRMLACVLRAEGRDDVQPKVRVRTWRIATENGLRILYGALDRSKPRDAAVVTNTYLVGQPGLEDLSKIDLRNLVNAYICFRHGCSNHGKNGVRYKAEEYAHLLQTEERTATMFVVALMRTLKGKNPLRRAPVLGAVFATCKVHPQLAGEFWRVVNDGPATEAGDPRLVLRYALQRHTCSGNLRLSGRNAVKMAPQHVASEEVYQWCLLAWNAYIEDKKVTLRASQVSGRPTVK